MCITQFSKGFKFGYGRAEISSLTFKDFMIYFFREISNGHTEIVEKVKQKGSHTYGI